MKVLSEGRATGAERGGVVALGNFDGVHLGHHGVLRFAREHALAKGAPLAVAVFEPHPRQHFVPDGAPFRLQTSAQRLRSLEALHADIVFELKFDADLARQSSEEFARVVLHDRFGASMVIVGPDFRFGAGRKGDVARLRALGADLGFDVLCAEVLADDGEKVSSSNIRAALADGQVERANRWLGRAWAVEGKVQRGAQRGRTIGFPTANIALGAYQRPAFGVYAVRVRIGGAQAIAGVANLGLKPTLATQVEPLLEAHVFNFSGDIYDAWIEVQLMNYLRPERRFDSFEALKQQIAIDASGARMLLAAPGSEKSPQ